MNTIFQVDTIGDALHGLRFGHPSLVKETGSAKGDGKDSTDGEASCDIEIPTGGDHGTTLISSDNKMGEVSTPSITYPKVMVLDVGGRIFKVSRDTLNESGLFRHQLSDRFTWEPQADGSYFLDADPELFEHLVRFMRRPEVFPLFYIKDGGFNYDLYNRLGAEAEYFQVGALCDWIKEKKYLRAVVTHTYNVNVCNLDDILPQTYPINQTEDRKYALRIRKIYICPRRILVHRGDSNRCGAACLRAKGDNENEYEEEPYVQVICAKKEVEFMAGICRPE